MLLSEIFSQLTYGELSQVSLGGAAMGQISEANYPVVVGHLNLGLIKLHKRFNLKEGRSVLTLIPSQDTYDLASDVLKLERVVAESGQDLGLNDTGDLLGCFTPKANVLRVPMEIADRNPSLPDWAKTGTLQLIYRQSCPPIDISWGEPDLVEVDLPDAYLEPLLLFVASRVHAPGDLSGQFNASNNYMAKFEAACKEIESSNLRVDQGGQLDRLHRNGWV